LLVIRLLDEVMILPVAYSVLAYNWRTFSIVWFFFQSVDNKQYTIFQSVDNKQYTNYIRDLIVIRITVFFSYCVLI